jgi:hypothetical protein
VRSAWPVQPCPALDWRPRQPAPPRRVGTCHPPAPAEGRDDPAAPAGFSSIQAAVRAAPRHGSAVVCPGVCPASATVDRDVHLYGNHGAVIDATGSRIEPVSRLRG